MPAAARAGLAPLLVAAALALGACGGDDATVTVTDTVSSGPAPGPPATTPTSGDAGAGTGVDGATPPADRTVDELTSFSSPSGNIGCYIDLRSVRCDIDDRDWDPPAAPAGCELDFGQGIELRAGGRAAFVCAGDTAIGGGEELDYGSSIAAGLLRCESEESGMTCRDVETGRGFSLAIAGYDIF
ncbi:MAG TPA: DUF6636 domain-containing protein [Solirubrobacterales bacterium]|nr:DUF6636 domain-containing protein [Solirubrobacterales bacterium]